MNRREALKLLSALPMVKSIEVANVAPNDVIVFQASERLSDFAKKNIKEAAAQIWANRKIVVLDSGLTMRIAREGSS